MTIPRVIGLEKIEEARQKGRVVFEVLPNDIITDLARETAKRLGIRLVLGPIEKPTVARTDGNTAIRRGLYRRSAKWRSPTNAERREKKRFGKIALVGVGGVGANIAHLAAIGNIAHEIVLIDISPGVAKSLALDLNHASGITRHNSFCFGSEKLADMIDANVVVVTAGQARIQGMTRTDLIQVNKRIILSTAEVIKASAPKAVVIVVTNPLDEMTFEMLRATTFPREKVLGMAGTLDSARLRNSLSLAAKVEASAVEALTLGSHGEEMTPIVSLARIKGRRLENFLSQQQIKNCEEEAVNGGGAVVALKKSGSATLAPAHATMQLLDNMRGAKVGPVPVSVMLEGEYEIEDVVLGVPAHLGMGGLISIEELPLTPEEYLNLQRAANAIRNRLGLSSGHP